ncbi:primosomal protein N' [Alkalicella caledoniensis]|uniref:Replication restart protein PriA n=1 Tax=Alkalicella caledoniensis TaxID=2731377 RepID=A0A7G9WCC9_ALKCA|nr:primosomal protein N' [Alkalicella caledoniensis]QNO16341.1 primosomal protein N' [Alkalicella caledoniensis]
MEKAAKIVVDCPLRDIDKTFDYMIPPHLDAFIEIGSRVIVPFNRRMVQGFVVDIEENYINNEKFKLKEIDKVLEFPSILDEKLVKLAKWLSFNYNSSLFSCIQSMLPRGIKLQLSEQYSLVRSTLDSDFNDFLSKPRQLGDILDNFQLTKDQINRYLLEGYIKKTLNIKTVVKEKYLQEITLDRDIDEITVPATALRQQQLLELLDNQQRLILSELPAPLRGAVKVFQEKGYIKSKKIKVYREPDTLNLNEVQPKELNCQQQKIFGQLVESIYEESTTTFLLKGITGSGKTEVYLRFVKELINNGKDAIILVPEISLTPMMVSRFKERFGDMVAVLHSGLTEGQKFDQWLKIKEGKVKIAVGARSAVFAPFKNLGAIIIDEEHESTYKQEEQPRYVTRDVAKKRLEQTNGTLLLGSATPSIESYYNSKIGNYKILELNERANNKPLPNIDIVDMREELIKGNKSIFSHSLHSAIGETLGKGEQVILFLNKRGFSATTLCRECGFTFKCPNCDVNLTSHHQGNFLICHYCNYSLSLPNSCPKCSSKHLRFNGLGTERLKEDIQKNFPGAKIIRMDNDTMSTASSYNEVYQNFLEGKANVLIGTQMIAKGFDFPKVTLVGIILADMTLNFPDYKSSEKTFQLITQVAGRAGRADYPGRVILQTYSPEHYSIRTSSQYGYEEFYNEELAMRRSLAYPPFTRLAKIEVVSKSENTGRAVVREIYNKLEEKLENIPESIQLLGPVVPAIPRLKNKFRFMIIVKFPHKTSFLNIINQLNLIKFKSDIITNIKVDIDPATLM